MRQSQCGNPNAALTNAALTNLELKEYWEATNVRRAALGDRKAEYGLPKGFEENREGINAAAAYVRKRLNART